MEPMDRDVGASHGVLVDGDLVRESMHRVRMALENPPLAAEGVHDQGQLEVFAVEHSVVPEEHVNEQVQTPRVDGARRKHGGPGRSLQWDERPSPGVPFNECGITAFGQQLGHSFLGGSTPPTANPTCAILENPAVKYSMSWKRASM